MDRRRLPITTISVQQYDTLVKDLRSKIWVLTKSIKILLEKSGTFDIGIAAIREESHINAIGALYTHAIEQLGKLKMVEGCEKNNDGNYDLSPISEDFYNHYRKLQKALENIEDNRILDIFKQPGIQISPQMRLDLLHSDIDHNGDVKEMPKIDIEKFKIAIEAFHTEQLGN